MMLGLALKDFRGHLSRHEPKSLLLLLLMVLVVLVVVLVAAAAGIPRHGGLLRGLKIKVYLKQCFSVLLTCNVCRFSRCPTSESRLPSLWIVFRHNTRSAYIPASSVIWGLVAFIEWPTSTYISQNFHQICISPDETQGVFH